MSIGGKDKQRGGEEGPVNGPHAGVAAIPKPTAALDSTKPKPWQREAKSPGLVVARKHTGVEEPLPVPTGRGDGDRRPPVRSVGSRFDSDTLPVEVAPAIVRQQSQIARPAAGPELGAGESVDEFCDVVRTLARGRVYTVYLAHHRVWETEVVVKVPRLDLDATERGRILTEAERWMELGVHPHVACCLYAHLVEDVPVVVVEHLKGGSLRSWIDSGRARNLRIGLSLALQMCHGLERAHSAQLRHGAVKPENFLLGDEGNVMLTDPGIGGGVVLDSAEHDRGRDDVYIAPERWIDTGASAARIDVFSLGVCLYEMLTGDLPFATTRGPGRADGDSREAESALPESLADLLRSCVNRDSEKRPRSVAAIRDELARAHRDLFGFANVFEAVPAGSWRADSWNNRALVHLLFGRNVEAELAWENALADDPDHLLATYNYGVARWRRGALPDSAVLRQLHRVSAGDAVTRQLLSAVHCERGDRTSALRILEVPTSMPALGASPRLRPSDSSEHGLLREWAAGESYVSGISLSADGTRVAFANDDGVVFVSRTDDSEEPLELKEHEAAVSSVLIDGDGRRVFSAGDDGVLNVWDVNSGALVQTVATPGRIFALDFSEERSLLVLASGGTENFIGVDGSKLLVWDLGRERLLTELIGHENVCKAVAISRDGNLAVSGADDLTVRIWDLRHGGACRRVLEGHEHFIACVALSGDGKLAASGGWDKTVRLWDTVTGCARGVLRGHEGIVNSVALSADGTTVVSGGWDRTVRVWDSESGRCWRTIEAHEGIVSGVALSADGRTAASSSWDMTARAWSIPNQWKPVCVPVLSRCRDLPELPSGEPDPDEHLDLAERAMAAGRVDEALRRVIQVRAGDEGKSTRAEALWETLSRVCVRREVSDVRVAGDLDLPRPPACVALSSGARRLAAGDVTGSVTIWNPDLERCERGLEGHQGRVACVALGPDETMLLSGGADRTARLWDLASGECMHVLEGHTSIVSAVSWSSDRCWALSGSYDHELRLWDLASGRCANIIRGHRRQVSAVALAADQYVFASGDCGGTIAIGDPHGAPAFEVRQHSAPVTQLCFDRNGEKLLSSAADGSLMVWHVRDRRCLLQLTGHCARIVGLWFRSEVDWAASLDVEGVLFFWNTRTGLPTSTCSLTPSHAPTAAMSPDSDRLLVAFADGAASLWELEWELEAPEAKREEPEAPRPLDGGGRYVPGDSNSP
jgi:WD40 repeat protein